MSQRNTIIAALMSSGLLVALVGCGSSHAEYKQAAVDRWTEARAGIMYGVAVQQFEVGDLDKCQRTLNQVLSMDPQNAKFNVLAARIAMEKGELERAYHHLEIALTDDPQSAEAHYLLGVVLQRWQRYESALEAYHAAYEADPEDISGLLAEGEMLVKLDRDAEALTRLGDKLVYFEHNAALRASIARIQMKLGQLDAALEMFREAYLLSPDDPSVLEQLALAEYAACQYSEAIYHLGRLLEDKQLAERRDLRMALGDCFQATNRASEARAIFLKLVQEDSTDVNAWIKLGQAASIVGDDLRLAEAARQVVNLAPDRHEGHLLAGMSAARRGDVSEALAAYERAARLAPKSAAPHILKGMVLEEAGDLSAAKTAYARALAVAPDDTRAQRLLAGLSGSRMN